MKPLCFLSFFFLLALYGCRSKFEHFNKQALAFAENDKRIDQKEYETLINQIKVSDGRGFQQLKSENGQPDNGKVVSYLQKLFEAKKLTLITSDIWQPENKVKNPLKFNINVFLENSISMDGYVVGVSKFKTTIFRLLADLDGLPSKINFQPYYLNTQSFRIESPSDSIVSDFIRRINSLDFQQVGGRRGSTDIENMMSSILKQTDENNLSIFISDCVFSPGHTDATQYLQGQENSLYYDFKKAVAQNPNLAVVILQCSAKFEGTYYDYQDNAHPNMKIERPYYIWFIGTIQQIKNLSDNGIFSVNDSYKTKLVIQSNSVAPNTNYKILYRPRVGDFDPKLLSKGIISDASVSKNKFDKGIFGFNVSVDFSNSLQDGKYYLDSNNYSINNRNYSILLKDNLDPTFKEYTHIVTLQTNKLQNEDLEIRLTNKIPEWVFNSTSDDDRNIETDTTQLKKTYGFEYMVRGVFNAFHPDPTKNENRIMKIKIIKAKQSYAGFLLTLFILIMVFAFFIFKRKK